jgi:predicted secreted protein
MRLPNRLLIAVAALLVAAPAAAYTIFLKDGSQLLAKKKYEVRGSQAIITLVSGQKTMFPLSEIDVPRTEKANEQDLGTAILIEGGEKKDVADAAPPPPSRPELGDLIRSGAAGVQVPQGEAAVAPPEAPAQEVAPAARPSGFGGPQVANTPSTAGFVKMRDTNLAGSLKQFVAGRGLGVEVFQGSKLFFETESEAMVFRSLLAGAAALLQAREQSNGQVDGIELVCRTSEGSAAGTFTLTPAQAEALLAGRLEITSFFVNYVEF